VIPFDRNFEHNTEYAAGSSSTQREARITAMLPRRRVTTTQRLKRASSVCCVNAESYQTNGQQQVTERLRPDVNFRLFSEIARALQLENVRADRGAVSDCCRLSCFGHRDVIAVPAARDITQGLFQPELNPTAKLTENDQRE
jgi:hypothetical protein